MGIVGASSVTIQCKEPRAVIATAWWDLLVDHSSCKGVSQYKWLVTDDVGTLVVVDCKAVGFGDCDGRVLFLQGRLGRIRGYRSHLFAFFVVAFLPRPPENKLLAIHQPSFLERCIRGVVFTLCTATLLAILVTLPFRFPLFLLSFGSVLRRLCFCLFFPLSFPLFELQLIKFLKVEISAVRFRGSRYVTPDGPFVPSRP